MRAGICKSVALAATVVIALLSAGAPTLADGTMRAYQLPPVRHIFVIVLENESYAATFGHPTAFPYLAGTLVKRGVLLRNYYAIGHASNDNYVAMVSGQPPNTQNQADCQTFDNFTGGKLLPDGVESGTGCVYPADILNIGNQLSAKHLSWKGYMQDMGNDPGRESALCGHPQVSAADNTQAAVPGDGYATRHDPFVYFHSVIDNAAYCDAHVVPLGPVGGTPATGVRGGSGLQVDLKKASTTPAFSYIVPNLCSDGHDFPCVNQRGGGSAAADIDAFLTTWVPRITGSPAFRHGGMLEITFDEGSDLDASACCGERPGPGADRPGIIGPGGGRIGALLISPFIRGGTVSNRPYNHYSSLASWEDLFGLRRLAYAATVRDVFGADVFTRYTK